MQETSSEQVHLSIWHGRVFETFKLCQQLTPNINEFFKIITIMAIFYENGKYLYFINSNKFAHSITAL